MKKIIVVILILTLVFCFTGCKKDSADNEISSSEFESSSNVSNSSSLGADFSNSTSSNKPSSGHSSQDDDKNNSDDANVLNNIKTEKVKINSLDKLNFYAVKKAIAENSVTLLSDLVQTPKITTLSNDKRFNMLNLSNATVTNINVNSTFTITMYSYFTVTINDSMGFLAQKLGGTGSVEVVITHNNFNNMITFKKGERYYSCLQTSLTENAMSFSSRKYVNGFKLVENYDQENYEYTVYFEGDTVVGINCGRYDADGINFKYVADDIKINNNFYFVIHKKQSFSAEQLEKLFSANNSFVDDGIVLNDGTVLFGESSITDNSVAFKNNSGVSIITNNDIKTVKAMYNNKFGFCIKLDLVSNSKISGKTSLDFYLSNSKVRSLTLQKEGSDIYITDLNNKSRMSDVFYKMTAIYTGNQIGRIVDHDDFIKEASKRLNLNDYNLTTEDYSDDSAYGVKSVHYTYTLKYDKSISYKASNYDVTIDDITVTLPIKVSDFLNKGFTIKEKHFVDSVMQGGAEFRTPNGNKINSFIMNFYGNSEDFNSCYITQLSFLCYEKLLKYQEGISPTRPNFELFDGINKDSTLDDIISRLGEPNKIIIYALDNQYMNHKSADIHLSYKVSTPSLPKGDLVFNIRPVLNSDTPTDYLLYVSFDLQ